MKIMSGLIWIQVAGQSDGIPERFFWKADFKENLQTTEKYENTQHAKISIMTIIAKQKGEEKVWILSLTVTD